MNGAKTKSRWILICYLSFVVGIFSTVYAHFDPDSLRKHIYFLGSDSLQGRAPGTSGSRLAAEYIASNLRKSGLTPIGDNNSFFQPIPMHGSIPLSESTLRLFINNKVHDFELGRDYLLYKYGAQTFLPQSVPTAFVGYGIIAPEFDYDDYRSVDAKGKIVVFLSGEPYSDDPNYFDGMNATVYSHAEAKHRLAISQGALGSIMILPEPSDYRNRPHDQARNWNHWQQEFAFEHITLSYSAASQLSVVMNFQAAARLFEGAPFTLAELLYEDTNISGFPLSGRIAFRGEFIHREFIDNNVVAMLEGSDQNLKDTYLLVSAHYDHLGIGPAINGDSIYNGVMDNAAGVAAVLEIARAFGESAEKPKRSIIFLFSTAEEKGLLGSIYYTDNPLRPLYKTVANINVDGLAMFDTFNDVVGVGAEFSSLGDMLTDVCRKLELEISPISTEFSVTESYFRSDHFAFAQAGIPSVLVMEGLNYQNLTPSEGRRRQIEWLENYYHTPFDDLNQPLNFDAAVQHCHLLFQLCQYIADEEAEPQWKPGAPFIDARRQTIAEKR